MPRDLPDWGALNAQETVYEVTDLGELAVRLGSIVTHDRRGDVLILETFESGLRGFQAGVSGTNAAADLSMVRAAGGQFSARLKAGSTVLKSAQLSCEYPYPTVSAFGIEVSALLPAAASRFTCRLALDDGTTRYDIAARWNGPTERLEIQTPSGWVVVGEAAPLHVFQTRIFNVLKVVGDPASGEYMRLIFNEQDIDISAYSLLSAVSILEPHLHIGLHHADTGTSNPIVYVDNLIVTRNEPA